jgi:hypothetical protein
MSSPSDGHGGDHSIGARGQTSPVEEVFRRAAEGGGEFLGRRPAEALRAGEELGRVGLAQDRDPVDLAGGQTGHQRLEAPDPGRPDDAEGVVGGVGVGHDTGGYQVIPGGATKNLPGVGQNTDTPPVVLRTSAVADRIRAYVKERQRGEPKFSMRSLSRASGLNPTQLTMTCKRLDEGADIDTSILVSVAAAMGRTHHWLLHGTEHAGPAGVRLRDLPGWPDAAAQARARYPRLTVKSMDRLGESTVPEVPTHLDVASIVALAVALDMFLGES